MCATAQVKKTHIDGNYSTFSYVIMVQSLLERISEHMHASLCHTATCATYGTIII